MISNTTVLPIAEPSVSAAQANQNASASSPAAVPDSLPADIIKEAELIFSRFRLEGASRLAQVASAEDAADAALHRFGSSVRGFLRDAVSVVAPPSAGEGGAGAGEVLFESKDAEGRRVVHATRFEAQLHVIHMTSASFTADPVSDEYAGWKAGIDVDKKTEAIARDLREHEELRRAMERLVPEQVEYGVFWTRYYFLRHVVEMQEQMRRELLKRTTLEEEEEVGWGDEEEEGEEKDNTPNATGHTEGVTETPATQQALETSEELKDTPADAIELGTHEATPVAGTTEVKEAATPKLNEPRRSNEHSIADSDASYDVVSGAASRTPNSPTHEKDAAAAAHRKAGTVKEESDEEDWE